MNLFSKITNIFLLVVLGVVVVIAGVAGYAMMISRQDDNAFVFGFQPFVIASDSMEPALKTNSVVLIREVADAGELKPGEIIVFWEEERWSCYRIQKFNDEGGITTKGDNPRYLGLVDTTNESIKGRVDIKCNWLAPVVKDVRTSLGGIRPIGLLKWGGIVFGPFAFLAIISLVVHLIMKRRKKEQLAREALPRFQTEFALKPDREEEPTPSEPPQDELPDFAPVRPRTVDPSETSPAEPERPAPAQSYADIAEILASDDWEAQLELIDFDHLDEGLRDYKPQEFSLDDFNLDDLGL